MHLTRKELALIETVLSTSKLALIKYLRELPEDTSEEKLAPIWSFDDKLGALLEKVRTHNQTRSKPK